MKLLISILVSFVLNCFAAGNLYVNYISVAPPPPSATNFFVGTFDGVTGNDANNGLAKATPWLTLAHTITNIGPAATVWMGSNTFTENITLTVGGISNYPIRFTSYYPLNRAVISQPAASFATVRIVNAGYITLDSLNLGGRFFSNEVNGVTYALLRSNAVVLWDITNQYSYYGGLVITNCLITNGTSLVSMLASSSNNGGYSFQLANNTMSNGLLCGVFILNKEILDNFKTLGRSYVTVDNWRNGFITGNDIGYTWGVTNGQSAQGVPLGIYNQNNTRVVKNYLHHGGLISGGVNGGCGGFVAAYAKDVRFDSNEVAFISETYDHTDGVGFDWDLFTTNCIATWNYVHDCDGAGIFQYSDFITPNYSNQYYFNLSINNNGGGNHAEAMIWGNAGSTTNAGIISTIFANNTCVAKVTRNRVLYFPSTTFFRGTNLFANNILSCVYGGAAALTYDGKGTNVYLVNNDYWATKVARWEGVDYTTIAGFRSGSGQETGTGFKVDPQFVNAASEGTLWPNVIATGGNHVLQGGVSTLINAGISLAPWGITTPVLDLAGISTAQTNSVGAYTQ